MVDDVAEELDELGFDHEYVNTVRETITAAVTQPSDKALIVVAISVVAAIYVASQWVRGVRRGLDAVLERQHYPAGLSRDLRDALALVLLFSLAMLLQFAGGRIATNVFGGASLLRQGAAYLLAAIAGTCAYAYIYAVVAAPPRPPRTALGVASVATMLLWFAATVGFRVFAERWPGYATNYGVFATPIVGLIWLWLTNVSVLLAERWRTSWAGVADRAANAGITEDALCPASAKSHQPRDLGIDVVEENRFLAACDGWPRKTASRASLPTFGGRSATDRRRARPRVARTCRSDLIRRAITRLACP